MIRIATWTFAPLLILLAPLIAMQFTGDVAWDGADFALGAALLIAAGAAYGIFTARNRAPMRRVAIGLAIILALVLVWIEAAVGIFH
ncbi:MAG: hypothetical protein Tsb0010_06300 [Parvularculaceae bacterium]